MFRNTTPQKMKSDRAKLDMTQDAIADEMELSVRFWRNREIGARPIPRWLSYAIIGLLHVRGKLK